MDQDTKTILLRAILLACLISPCLCCCGPSMCGGRRGTFPKTGSTATPPTPVPAQPQNTPASQRVDIFSSNPTPARPARANSTRLPKPTPVAPGVPSPTPEAQWATVQTWTGSHRQNTESFTINSHDWRVSWRITAPDPEVVEFDGVIRHEDGSVFETISGTQTDTLLTSHMRGAGTYYLELSVANGEYEVVVEEER
jgi:hypothetical protein